MASLPLDFDSNSNILNFNNEFKEKPAKAQLPNSNLPVSDPSVSSILSFNKDGINLKPDQPIFNFNFPQNVQSTPRSSSISESQFINVSIHDYGSEAQTPQSSVSRKASCCGGSSKPSKPAVPISSCCSSGSVAPNSRSSCCSGNSVALFHALLAVQVVQLHLFQVLRRLITLNLFHKTFNAQRVLLFFQEF